jgi:hypothetical protein
LRRGRFDVDFGCDLDQRKQLDNTDLMHAATLARTREQALAQHRKNNRRRVATRQSIADN